MQNYIICLNCTRKFKKNIKFLLNIGNYLLYLHQLLCKIIKFASTFVQKAHHVIPIIYETYKKFLYYRTY